MKRFVEGIGRGQATLFPECLADWIDGNNPVQVIDVFVGRRVKTGVRGIGVPAPEIEKYIVQAGIILLKFWPGKTSRKRASSPASTIPCGSGSSVRWTLSPTAAGTTTRGRATRC
jgi:hypothetical protein